MTSKRLQNAAMCNRVATISETLDKASAASTRQRIDAWLEENEECHTKLLKLMETGLILEMVTGENDTYMPRSCTKLSLVSDAQVNKTLATLNSQLDFATLRLAKKCDPKIKDKLLYMALVLEGNYPIRGRMQISDWKTAISHRTDIAHNRLARLSISATGAVDWSISGIYHFAIKREGSEPSTYLKVQKEAYKDATHVLHAPSGIAVSLRTLEAPPMDERWRIESNWSEAGAYLSNGGRCKVELFQDFKSEPYFSYDERLKTKFPDSPFLTSPFLTQFGKHAADLTKAQNQNAQATAREAVEVVKQAGLNNIYDAIVPAGKRRRAT